MRMDGQFKGMKEPYLADSLYVDHHVWDKKTGCSEVLDLFHHLHPVTSWEDPWETWDQKGPLLWISKWFVVEAQSSS